MNQTTETREQKKGRLAKLVSAFELSGGRGVEIAEEIDALRAELYPTRLTRLQALADECLDIYSEETSRALNGGEVPRYALMTSEGSAESSYRDNPNLTVHETAEELAEVIAGQLEEGWPPLQVVDLETGEDIGYKVRVEIEG